MIEDRGTSPREEHGVIGEPNRDMSRAARPESNCRGRDEGSGGIRGIVLEDEPWRIGGGRAEKTDQDVAILERRLGMKHAAVVEVLRRREVLRLARGRV